MGRCPRSGRRRWRREHSGAAVRHVWVDGELRPADGAHLSAFDRGFQLGDGIFETLRARGGRLTELAEHAARLQRSADGLGIELPDDVEGVLARGIADVLAAELLDGADGDASVRVTVSRGSWRSRGLLPPRDERLTATIVIQAWPVTPPPADHLSRGLSLVASSVRRDPENPIVTLKTTSRADYVYARLEARRAGADDALFLTISGHLSEATTANVFLVRTAADGMVELATPSLDCAILPRHDALVAAALGERRGSPPRRGLAPPRGPRRGRRGVHVLLGRGRAPDHPVQWLAHRQRRARPVDPPRPRRPRAVHRRGLTQGLAAGRGVPVMAGRRSPAAHASTSSDRRRSRVSGRFALITQCVPRRR